jgi:hypothetical protein
MATKGAEPGKSTWVNEETDLPLITERARQLDSFVDAIADGKVTDAEVKAQEARVMKLLKDIEPQLEPQMHARVTELLCELSAYDMMQVLNIMQHSRPQSKFRG